jgi:hypothetical protein
VLYWAPKQHAVHIHPHKDVVPDRGHTIVRADVHQNGTNDDAEYRVPV